LQSVCVHHNARAIGGQYETVDTIEPESHGGPPIPEQDSRRTAHCSSYVNLPEEPPHSHTELQDKYGYSESVCVHDNERASSRQYEKANPTEPGSHCGHPRPHQYAALNVHDSSAYVNMPEEPPHSHTELQDKYGYSQPVCNHDNVTHL